MMQFLADVSGKVANGGPNPWACATHLGDEVSVSGSWLQFGPCSAVAVIWEINQQMKEVSHSAFQMYIYISNYMYIYMCVCTCVYIHTYKHVAYIYKSL